MTEAAIFMCSICGEPSHEICVYCTKDACGNHHCERCKSCSDCCECEMPLSASEPAVSETGPPAAAEAPATFAPETGEGLPPQDSETTEPAPPENPII